MNDKPPREPPTQPPGKPPRLGDIVLINSDSDVDQRDRHVNKKVKVADESFGQKCMIKPYMESTPDMTGNYSSDFNVNGVLNGDSNENVNGTLKERFDGKVDEKLKEKLDEKLDSDTNTIHISQNVNDENLESEGYVSSSEEEERDGTSSGNSSSDILAVPLASLPEDSADGGINRKVVCETRKYLKLNGTMKFLDKYLPATASSEDLLHLIFKLGVFPRNLPSRNDGDKLIELIKILHKSMKKIVTMRTRLEDVYSVDHVLEKIAGANKILLITGAGISTSLGIPDFRSSKGFYAKLQHLGLSDPQEVFDLDFFHTDPNIFYLIAHMILPPEKSCSSLHTFIRVLQDKGKLLRNYTQNIDNLEMNAGIDPDKLIQCHGSFAFATCMTCKYKVKGEAIFPSIRDREIPLCPKCMKTRQKLLDKEDSYVPESYGVMKPDITFFGEPLPSRFHDNIRQDLLDCDLLISVGTSLKVAPVASIVESVPESVPQILINKDPIDHCNFDVSILGFCDDIATYLCNRLGRDWRIPHPDYEELTGKDGTNLSLITLDENHGHYAVINKARQQESHLTNNINASVSAKEEDQP